jgi:hypothetical protein
LNVLVDRQEKYRIYLPMQVSHTVKNIHCNPYLQYAFPASATIALPKTKPIRSGSYRFRVQRLVKNVMTKKMS